MYEASNLNLSYEKASHLLNWSPIWGFEESIFRTIDWYKKFYSGRPAINCCLDDIKEFYRQKNS